MTRSQYLKIQVLIILFLKTVTLNDTGGSKFQIGFTKDATKSQKVQEQSNQNREFEKEKNILIWK